MVDARPARGNPAASKGKKREVRLGAGRGGKPEGAGPGCAGPEAGTEQGGSAKADCRSADGAGPELGRGYKEIGLWAGSCERLGGTGLDGEAGPYFPSGKR